MGLTSSRSSNRRASVADLGPLIRSYLDDARPRTRYQQALYRIGACLVLVAVAGGVIAVLVGAPLIGPVSWRKPFTFSLSFGITFVTVAWVFGWLGPHRRAGWLVVTLLALGAAAEVGLLTLQSARGVASHFNRTTPLDATVFLLMGFAILVVAVGIVIVAAWSFIDSHGPPSVAVACQAALLAVVLGIGVGFVMLVRGSSTVGEASLTVPHAVGLHGAQVMIIVSMVVGRARWTETRRRRAMLIAATSYAVIWAAMLAGALAGTGVDSPRIELAGRDPIEALRGREAPANLLSAGQSDEASGRAVHPRHGDLGGTTVTSLARGMT